MEHIIVTDIGNGYKRMRPAIGYTLYNKMTRMYYSEAVTKTTRYFSAVQL